jgi:hypothetical protein
MYLRTAQRQVCMRAHACASESERVRACASVRTRARLQRATATRQYNVTRCTATRQYNVTRCVRTSRGLGERTRARAARADTRHRNSRFCGC